MELRFLPNSMSQPPTATPPISTPSPPLPSADILPPLPHRRTLDRSYRNLNNQTIICNGGSGGDNLKTMADGDCGLTQVRTASMRRPPKARTPGSVPGSPRIIRGPSAELLQSKFAPSPVPVRVKRAAIRLGRADNLSSGSLNSIEV